MGGSREEGKGPNGAEALTMKPASRAGWVHDG